MIHEPPGFSRRCGPPSLDVSQSAPFAAISIPLHLFVLETSNSADMTPVQRFGPERHRKPGRRASLWV